MALAAATEPPTISYTITAEDEAMPQTESIPEDMMEKAKLKRLDFRSMVEMLGERFHASPALLKKLNPTSQFAVGEQITVPNVQIVSAAEGQARAGHHRQGVEAEQHLDRARRERRHLDARAGDQRQRT